MSEHRIIYVGLRTAELEAIIERLKTANFNEEMVQHLSSLLPN